MEAKTAKKKRGRKPLTPKSEQRAKVRLWTAGGISEEHQAELLGICRNTLRKRFAADLAKGAALEQARNLERLSEAADDGNVAAMKHLDTKFAAAAANSAWSGDAPATDVTDGQHGKATKKEASLAAAESAMSKPDAGWGSDLMPDGVIKFPTSAARN